MSKEEMSMSRKRFLILWLACMPWLYITAESHEWLHDPTTYTISQNHPLKSVLDSIFPSREVIQNSHTLKEAGFQILREQRASGILLATHPRLKGYLIKLYLDSQPRHRRALPQQEWLIQRCRGAEKLRNCIRVNHIRSFTVPDKWLYELPPKSKSIHEHTFVLVVTYMHLVTPHETSLAWRNVTKRQLQELMMLMKVGATSGAFIINVPSTQEGKFAFIDTEYADRIFSKEKLKTLSLSFSPDMGRYWLHLVNKS